MRALRSAFKQFNNGINNSRNTAEQLNDYAMLAFEFFEAGLYVYENELEAMEIGTTLYNEVMMIVGTKNCRSNYFFNLGYYCLQTAVDQRLPPESWTIRHAPPNDEQFLRNPLPRRRSIPVGRAQRAIQYVKYYPTNLNN